MKVRTSSWHYRLNSFMHDFWNPPRSLCAYFWHTVASLLGATAYAAISLAAAFCAVAPIIAAAVFLLGFALPLDLLWAAILGCMFWMFVSAVLAIRLFAKSLKASSSGRQAATEQPNLFLSYLRAAKKKVCPTIDYTR